MGGSGRASPAASTTSATPRSVYRSLSLPPFYGLRSYKGKQYHIRTRHSGQVRTAFDCRSLCLLSRLVLDGKKLDFKDESCIGAYGRALAAFAVGEVRWNEELPL